MRILLINQCNGIHINHNPPLGVLYLASALKRTGHSVSIHDQGARENDLRYPAFDEVRDFNPDIVGFSLYTFGLPNTLRYIEKLKNEFPSVTILLGGHHATALPERTMLDCPQADYLVYGEGEITTVELARAIELGTDVSKIAGVYWRKNGNISFTHPRPYVENLDGILFPANELIQHYTYPSENITKGKKVLNMLAARGCPFHCAYCNKAVYGSSYRQRSPKNVVDEIEYMFTTFGYDEVMFHDELFTANKAWLHALFDEIRKRKLRFPWRCLGRVGTVTFDDLRLMREHGCYIIAFGLESGNNEVRRDIGRIMTNDAIRTAFQNARKAGLMTYAFNMINHRLDTYDTVRDTFNLMCDVNAEFSPVFVCSPLAGSKLHQLLPPDVRYNWERFNSYRDFGANPISISSIPDRELVTIADQMESFYYSRFRYFFENILSMRSSSKTKVIMLKLWTGYLLVGRLKYLAHGSKLYVGKKTSSIGVLFSNVVFTLLKAIVWLFRKNSKVKSLYHKISM